MALTVLVGHTTYQHPGGEDVVYQHERELLRRQGHTVVTLERSNHDANQLSPVRIGACTVWSATAYRAVKRLIQQHSPDVAHFHNTFFMTSPSVYHACKAADVPVVQTLHNYRIICPGALLTRGGSPCEDCLGRTLPWPALKHRCYRGSLSATAAVVGMVGVHRLLGTWSSAVDLYIAPSEFVRRQYMKGGVPGDRIAVKPHFVHPDPGFQPNPDRYALFIGRLSEEKGLHTLLQSWQSLRSDVPLQIVGSGPLAEALHQAAGSDPAISLLGWQSPEVVAALLKRAYVVIMPSEVPETFGRVAIEALATGTPVIASNLGALPELVQPGRTGLLFEAGDATDLADQIAWAYDHEVEWRQMRHLAREAFEERYTAEANYQRLRALYLMAMKANPEEVQLCEN